jgi:hypothetical protein
MAGDSEKYKNSAPINERIGAGHKKAPKTAKAARPAKAETGPLREGHSRVHAALARSASTGSTSKASISPGSAPISHKSKSAWFSVRDGRPKALDGVS